MVFEAEQLALEELVSQSTEKISGRKNPDIAYIGLEHIAQGEPRILGTLPASESISTNNIFHRGDILFGKLRPNLRKSLQVDFDGYCSTDILVFRVQKHVWSRFAAHLFQWHWVFREAVSTAEGTKMPRTSWDKLRAFRVFVPTFAEQRRIAEILDTADEAIRQTERVIAKLRQVKAGLLHDLLTRGLDAEGRLRDPEAHPEQFRDSPLGRIPTEWEIRKLTDIASYQNGGPFPSSEYGDRGIPLLRPGNLPDGDFVRWDQAHTTYLPTKWASLAPNYVILENELIMNLTAQSLEDQFLGRVCMTPSGTYCLLNQRLARFRAKGCHLLFLFLALKGPHFRMQIDRVSQGTKVQHIYDRNLNSIILPLPNTQIEQRAIAEILWTHSARIQSEEADLDKLRQLKRGLMDDLLTGRVRVPT